MGLTYVDGVVSNNASGEISVRFLVDSGATYTLLPKDVWQQLGLAGHRTVEFSLADGTLLHREVSECLIRLLEGRQHTPVILGEEGDEPLLGAVTLEELGLVLNPFSRTLHPMRMLLA